MVTERGASPSGPAPASSPGGSIYDLGYQPYTGRRLGRRHAAWALFVHGFRMAFGFGRSAREKAVPIGLAVIAILPAVIALAIAALVGDAVRPIRQDNYYELVRTVLMLFCAAVAPELVGRDQRYRTLSLYFSRALQRIDYALARMAALVAAMLVIALVPQLLLFLGLTLVRDDPVGYLAGHAGDLVPILGSGLLIALLTAGIGLAVASYTPRRAYATGGIVALFVVTGGLGSFVAEAGLSTLTRAAVLLSPFSLMDGFTAWAFGTLPRGDLLRGAGLPPELYAIAALGWVAVSYGIVLRRYSSIAA
jgi:ABC-2 type transport system permease protein